MPMRCAARCVTKTKKQSAAEALGLSSLLSKHSSRVCLRVVHFLRSLMHLRRPPTPNNAIAAMLQRTHFKVPCAAECLMLPACDGLSKAWATLSALTLPPPLLLPLVLPLPPQASQKLTSRNPLHKCSSLSKDFYCHPLPLTLSPAPQSRHPPHFRLLSCYSTDVESG